MSPDELRDLADTVSFSGRKDQRGEYEDAAVELRKFADVIEYAESDSHMLGMSDGYAEALRDINRIARGETTSAEPKDPCGCYQCIEREISGKPFPNNLVQFMVICETCGNKRCPHAEHHDNPCTGSNEPGQPGAVRYPKVSSESSPRSKEEFFARMDEFTARGETTNHENRRQD